MTQKTKDFIEQLVAFISSIGLAAGVFFGTDLTAETNVIIGIVVAGVPFAVTSIAIWRNHFMTGEKAFNRAREKERQHRLEQNKKGGL